MLPEKEITNPPPDCVVISKRMFNKPVERVYEAWTKPEQLKVWWGPKGFTNTFHIFNLNPGGRWSLTMHGPDGTDYENESIFIEIKRPEKLVWNHISGHEFQAVATFEKSSGKTLVTFNMIFASAEECEKYKVFVVDANEQNFDRLEALLAS
jgi:uncharacterized protein YndB with AHSA1/START domain